MAKWSKGAKQVMQNMAQKVSGLMKRSCIHMTSEATCCYIAQICTSPALCMHNKLQVYIPHHAAWLANQSWNTVW